jgi:NAD(P)-dependent dehydrogenase (short-subunit alcohol dehydrogenase family)
MSTPSAVIVGVGAERGLGAALCRRFAAGGYHVLVAGRTAGRIEQVAQTIRAAGGRAEPVVADTTVEADVIRLFDRTMAPGDGVNPADLVVYNAGNNRRMDFRELSADLFEDFWRVGCFGGSFRSAAAPSSSPELRRASVASRAMRISRLRRRACG